MSRKYGAKRYHKRVYESRKRIEAEERRARGEQTEQEKWAADLARRIQRSK